VVGGAAPRPRLGGGLAVDTVIEVISPSQPVGPQQLVATGADEPLVTGLQEPARNERELPRLAQRPLER